MLVSVMLVALLSTVAIHQSRIIDRMLWCGGYTPPFRFVVPDRNCLPWAPPSLDSTVSTA